MYTKSRKETYIRASVTVAKVERWLKNNPANTRALQFFKQYPDAVKASDGYPAVYPCMMNKKYIDEKVKGCYGGECLKCRDEYWGKEIK